MSQCISLPPKVGSAEDQQTNNLAIPTFNSQTPCHETVLHYFIACVFSASLKTPHHICQGFFYFGNLATCALLVFSLTCCVKDSMHLDLIVFTPVSNIWLPVHCNDSASHISKWLHTTFACSVQCS